MFSFSETSFHTKVKESSLPDYLPIDETRIVGLISFPKVLSPCEMKTASSRIWTWIVVIILYSNNHYTTSALLHCQYTRQNKFHFFTNFII